MAARLIDFFTGQPETGTTKSLESLQIETGVLEENEEETIPIYIDEKHVIKGFLIDSNQRPKDCEPTLEGEERKACFCICKEETCDQVKGEVNNCKKLDFNLKEQYVLRTKLDEKGNAKAYNCKIKREKADEKSKIVISC